MKEGEWCLSRSVYANAMGRKKKEEMSKASQRLYIWPFFNVQAQLGLNLDNMLKDLLGMFELRQLSNPFPLFSKKNGHG